MIKTKEEKMSKFFSKVYLWMFIGLLISGVCAYLTANTEPMLMFVYKNFKLILLSELIVVIAFSFLRRKVSSSGAKILFILYSAISGLTLSSIFLMFSIKSILYAFISSALLFGMLAIYGYTTKKDLTKFGRLLMFALIAIIICSLLNMFILNSEFAVIISIVSVVVFLGLTAWDMKNLKRIYAYYENDEEELSKASIYGALDLYLDFVNIFLQLLNLFGNSKD